MEDVHVQCRVPCCSARGPVPQTLRRLTAVSVGGLSTEHSSSYLENKVKSYKQPTEKAKDGNRERTGAEPSKLCVFVSRMPNYVVELFEIL